MTTKNPTRVALLAGIAAALPIAAHADAIIYSGPQTITRDANDSPPNYTVNVDGNSASAFTFTAEDVAAGPYSLAVVYVTPGSGNGYVASSSAQGTDPTPLMLGEPIGGSSTFSSGGEGTLSKTSNYFGNDYNWPADGSPAYLGVSFIDSALGSGTYYGWIDVEAQTDDATFTILGSAYNSTPGGSILAGQTSSVPEPAPLALLALGAVGLLALRARRKSARV
ncbi:MAG: PEP-CTERM sorting domain-containing protein [Bryobacteraceae bacterium]